MAWYYVKNGGTATGDAGRATTERTTSFATMGASAYYGTVGDILTSGTPTTAIASGDTISCSDLHANSASGSQTWTFPSGDTPTILQSVDDTAANVLKEGAAEERIGGGDIAFASLTHYFLYGMTLVVDDDVLPDRDSRFEFHKCTLRAKGNADKCLAMIQDGLTGILYDPIFDVDNVNGIPVDISNGGTLFIKGGSIEATTKPNQFFDECNDNAGCQVYCDGFDFSNLAANGVLVNDTGGGNLDNQSVFRFYACKVPSGATLLNETPAVGNQYRFFEFIGVDDTDAFRYQHSTNLGTIINEITTYRTSSAQLEGSTNYSFKVDTVSACSKTNPLRWALPVKYADVSQAASDVIKLHLTTDGSLNSADIGLFAGWSDSTNNTLLNFSSSVPKAESHSFIFDYTNAGSALTTESSEWTSAKTNEYSLSVTTSNADASSPLTPIVWLEVYTSTGANSIYVDSGLVFE